MRWHGPTEQKVDEPLSAHHAAGDAAAAAGGAIAASGEGGSLSSLIQGHYARMAPAGGGRRCNTDRRNTLPRNLEPEASLDQAASSDQASVDAAAHQWSGRAHVHVAAEYAESSVQDTQGSVPEDTAGNPETHTSTRAGLESSCAAHLPGVDVAPAHARNQTASVTACQAFALLNARMTLRMPSPKPGASVQLPPPRPRPLAPCFLAPAPAPAPAP